MADDGSNIFDTVTKQGDLFAAEVVENPGIAHPDPELIRERLQRLLDAVRAAKTVSPWGERETKMNLILFPQMARALPSDEAASLQIAFDFELVRLGIAA